MAFGRSYYFAARLAAFEVLLCACAAEDSIGGPLDESVAQAEPAPVERRFVVGKAGFPARAVIERAREGIEQDEQGFSFVAGEGEERAQLPLQAGGRTRVSTRGMRLDAALDGTTGARGEIEDGLVLYRGALGDGADVIACPADRGVAEHILFSEKPEREEVAYDLDIHGVAGLRLIDSTLELLDSTGTPRMRASAPFVIEEAEDGAPGRSLPVTMGIEGCAVDRDPRPSWGRPVTAPGSHHCRLVLSWSNATYPALLDPTWSAATNTLVAPHNGHTATKLMDGRVLIVGDYSNPTTEIFDPITRTFSTTDSTSEARSFHSSVLLADGRVLSAGGTGAIGPSTLVESYDPSTGQWSVTTPLNSPRTVPVASTLDDGRVLVAAGDEVAATAEVFDPADASWTPTPPMGALRSEARASLLENGRVLVTGGYDGATFQDHQTAELYDPIADAWLPTGNLVEERSAHLHVVLDDGRVLVLGGWNSPLVEIYDPLAGTFTQAPQSMAAHHANAAATRLQSGHVLVVGGWNVFDPTNIAELYDKETQLFVQTVNMISMRYDVTANLLSTGQVLVVGYPRFGTGGWAELFTPDETGEPCDLAAECATGYCVDGYCCNIACDSPCEACSAATSGGIDGTCSVVTVGTDPKNGCATEAVSTCGTTGECDGMGDCAFYAVDTLCGAPSCIDGMAKTPTCDGTGTCVEASASCAPFLCSGGGCSTTCNGDAACDQEGWCRQSDSTCQPDKPDGETCDRPDECLSGACLGFNCATPQSCVDDRTYAEPDGTLVDCAPYACLPDGCAESCSSVLSCASPNVCHEDGSCGPGTRLAAELACTVGSTSPRGSAWIGAMAAAAIAFGVARRRRRARGAAAALAMGAAALSSCSDEHTVEPASDDEPAEEASLESAAAAFTIVDAIEAHRPTRPSSTKGRRFAHVRVPGVASEPARIRDPRSGISLAFQLRGLDATPAEALPGFLVYRGALGGHDYAQRPLPWGTEDYVLFRERPSEPRVVYDVAIGGAASVRSVGGSVELLDEAGYPRLRMSPPVLLGSRRGCDSGDLDCKTRIFAHVEVGGCVVDRDPRAPWRRSLPAPKSSHCTIELTWDDSDLRYPALLDPAWTMTDLMVQSRISHTATLLADGDVLLAGGYDGVSGIPGAELYSPSAGVFSATQSMSVGREGHTATRLDDDRVVIIGGEASPGPTDIYDGGSFTSGPATIDGRWYHTATKMADGRVLVTGGYDDPYSAEVLNPSGAGAFTAAPNMPDGRSEHAAILLDDGRVLITGCSTYGAPEPEAALYDPGTNTFSQAALMATERCSHTMTKLADGRVVTAAGFEADYLESSSIEIFTPPVGPGPGSWDFTPPMATERVYHRALLLPTDQVFVAGGYDISGEQTVTTSIYDPPTDTWLVSTPMLQGRASFTLTLLSNGAVLAAGGGDYGEPINTAEILAPGDSGVPCVTAGECVSGLSCVDGVCCNAECAGPCESCLAAETGSGADGVCGPVAVGTLDAACPDEGAASCGSQGSCAEGGMCLYAPDGQSCGIRACVDGAVSDSTCDGEGGCVKTTTPCAPYACADGVECATACATTEECGAGTFCSSDGTCDPKVETGGACTLDEECESGACSGAGVCGGSGCLDEETLRLSNGEIVECAPYQCADGVCLTTCESILDCADGSVCNGAGVCVAPAQPLPATGCAIAHRNGSRRLFGPIAVLAALAAAFRARSRARARAR